MPRKSWCKLKSKRLLREGGPDAPTRHALRGVGRMRMGCVSHMSAQPISGCGARSLKQPANHEIVDFNPTLDI
jgi:hypothetical protein